MTVNTFFSRMTPMDRTRRRLPGTALARMLIIIMGCVLAGCHHEASTGASVGTAGDGRNRASGPIDATPKALVDATQAAIPKLNSYIWRGGEIPTFGASWGDYDRDGRPDLVLCRARNVELFHNEGGTLRKIIGSDLAYSGGSCQGGAWADFDRDGKEDLLLYGTDGLRIFHNSGQGRFVPVSSPGQFAFVDGHVKGKSTPDLSVVYATWVDFDQDGLLDILALHPGAPPSLYRNNGRLEFVNDSSGSRIDAVKHATFALVSFIGHDRSLEVVFADANGTPSILRGGRRLPLALVPSAAGLATIRKCRQFASADFNGDGRLDYAAATDRGVQVAIRKADGKFSVHHVLGKSEIQIVHSVATADLDNDGNVDILALNEDMTGMGGSTRLAVYLGNGDGTFRDASTASGASMIMSRNDSPMALADFDGNGTMDIFLPGANPTLVSNQWRKK